MFNEGMTTTPQPKVETYRLFAANGRYIRKATQVVLPGGEVVRFTEMMTKREALNHPSVKGV